MLIPFVLLAMQPNPEIRIGNFLVNAPSGIAFIDHDRAAKVIDFGLPYVAGDAAPDDSYHRQEVQFQGANVVLEWGRAGNGAVARISTDKDVGLPYEIRAGWDFARAAGSPTDIKLLVGLSRGPASEQMDGVVAVRAGNPAELRIGPTPPLVDAGKTLDLARRTYDRKRIQAIGDWGDFVGAIARNMNNSRIYSSDNHLVAYSVARGWAAKDVNNAPYFCWDSFFNANLGSLEDPKVARDTIRGLLAYQTPDGLVPNFGHWSFNNSRSSDDRSQPPVGALCVWNLHMRWPDKAFLAEVYPKLVKWHRWWPTARDSNHDGLLEWGSTTGGYQEAQWETGWDDNLHYKDAKMVGHTMNADAVDLNSMWSMDAEYLGAIADALGKHDEAKAFRAEHEEINRKIDSLLWNEKLGIYCSRLWEPANPSDPQSVFLTRVTPMNFYPLIAGVPDRQRADRVLAKLTNPKKFWGDWIIPTLSYDDPNYHEQQYWRGDVWAPVNYLLFQGVRRYASPDVRNEFARKSVDLFMRNWLAKGVCSENYFSTNGTPGGDPHYTWGALLNLVGLENLCSFDPDGSVLLNGTGDVSVTVDNLPIHGRMYRLVAKPGSVELSRRGRNTIRAVGEVMKFAAS